MGKTKPRYLRVLATDMTGKYPGEFTKEFEGNKAKVRELNMIEYSKEERNKLAGEITQEMKKRAREETALEAKATRAAE